jgi:hypothetical protein
VTWIENIKIKLVEFTKMNLKLTFVLLLIAGAIATHNAAEVTVGEEFANPRPRTRTETQNIIGTPEDSKIYQKTQELGDYLKNTSDDIADGAKQTYEYAKDKVGLTFESLFDTAKVAYYGEEKSTLEQMGDTAGEYYDTTIELIQNAYQSASDTAEDMYNKIKSTITGVEYKSHQEAETAYQVAEQEMEKAYSAAKDTVFGIYSRVKDTFYHEETTLEKLQRKGQEAQEAIEQAYYDTFGPRDSYYENVKTSIFDSYNSASTKLNEQYERAKEALKTQYKVLSLQYQKMIE